MATTTISIGIDSNGKIVVNPWEARAPRGDVIIWTTDLPAGATIVPLQDGLTMLKRSAEVDSPATALATNTGYYEYDVYVPRIDDPVGDPRTHKALQRVVAILIVSDYLLGQVPDDR